MFALIQQNDVGTTVINNLSIRASLSFLHVIIRFFLQENFKKILNNEIANF